MFLLSCYVRLRFKSLETPANRRNEKPDLHGAKAATVQFTVAGGFGA
jgi:hypothetical protein